MFTKNYKELFKIFTNYTSGNYSTLRTAMASGMKTVAGVSYSDQIDCTSSSTYASVITAGAAEFINQITFKTNNSNSMGFISCYKSSYAEDDYAKETQIGTLTTSVDNNGLYITVSNGNSTDITINTIQVIMKLKERGASTTTEFLMAEFELGDTTIPSGQSKTWVIKPVFNAVQVS